MLEQTGIREGRRRPVFHSPNVYAPVAPQLLELGPAEATGGPGGQTVHCYVCKQHYTEIHHFYDQLCPSCGDLNSASAPRPPTCHGRTALLTGGRVKIGYQAGLKLLRAGASLVVTTRFPRDAAMRLAREPDFDDWRDRVEVFGLDLRHTPSVEAFCAHLSATHGHLDYIVNNACQTVRRPPEFYRHMLELETASASTIPDARAPVARRLQRSASSRAAPVRPRHDTLSVAVATGLIEPDSWPGSRARPRCRSCASSPTTAPTTSACSPKVASIRTCSRSISAGRNSWRLMLDEVSSVELLETQLVNAVAPFVLNARLKHLLVRAPGAISTSSTCRRWKVSSTDGSRPPATRTRTWPRRR